MPTLVDSLVVSLGLDASGFTAGQKRLIADLKATEDASTRTAKAMQASGSQAAEFFSLIKTEALSLLGVFLGGKGIETFVRDTTKSLADLGRQAFNIGESAQGVQAFANAIERMGGNADAARSSLEGIARAKQEWITLGDNPQFVQFLSFVGANVNDSPLAIMQHFANFVKATEGTPGGAQRIQQYGAGIGLDVSTINSIIQMERSSDLAAEMRRSFELGDVASKQQIEAATKFQTAVGSFEQAVEGLSRSLIPWENLAKILDRLTLDIIQPTWSRDLGDAGFVASAFSTFGMGLITNPIADWISGHLGFGSGKSGGPLPPDIEAEVRRQAGLRGLDPDHMVRLYQKEGGGYDNVSPTGAFGPSQLMPETAARFGVTRNSSWQENVRGGLDYYRWLLTRFNGNYQAADAAYNAGENNPGVLRFFQTGDPSGLPAETRDYVNSINRTPNGVPRRGPAFGAQGLPDPSLAPNRLAGPRAGSSTANDNSTVLNVGAVNVYPPNGDPKSIAAGINRALADEVTAQSNRGLQ